MTHRAHLDHSCMSENLIYFHSVTFWLKNLILQCSIVFISLTVYNYSLFTDTFFPNSKQTAMFHIHSRHFHRIIIPVTAMEMVFWIFCLDKTFQTLEVFLLLAATARHQIQTWCPVPIPWMMLSWVRSLAQHPDHLVYHRTVRILQLTLASTTCSCF